MKSSIYCSLHLKQYRLCIFSYTYIGVYVTLILVATQLPPDLVLVNTTILTVHNIIHIWLYIIRYHCHSIVTMHNIVIRWSGNQYSSWLIYVKATSGDLLTTLWQRCLICWDVPGVTSPLILTRPKFSCWIIYQLKYNFRYIFCYVLGVLY